MLGSDQKKFLRGLAHSMKPSAFVGQKGVSDSLVRTIDDALTAHELVKVKFIDFKEKEMKAEISRMIEKRTGCEMVGRIGHVAIFFRRNPDTRKRKISLP